MKAIFCMLFCSLLLALADLALATEGLMLSPLRVVFEPGEKFSDLTIYNRSETQPVRYTLSTVALRMGADGKMHEVKQETAIETVARRILRFSPSTAVLPPSGKQVVRMMLRKPGNLPDGEYLTYLAATPEKLDQSLAKGAAGNGVSFNIALLVGVRIPVIMRVGMLSMQASPTRLAFENMPNGGRKAVVDLAYSGTRSSVLTVRLERISSGGTADLLGEVKRVVTYLPLTRRIVSVPLRSQVVAGESVRVSLFDEEEDSRLVGEGIFTAG